MTQALTTTEQAARAIAVEVFGADRLEVIRDMIAKNCTDSELAVFAEVCNRTKLDPFARQIYAIKRAGLMTIQISIDGARLAAERSGKYLGQTAPQWCDAEGVWRDVWLAEEPPAAARIGVWKTGAREPTWGVARFRSYAQSTPTWKTMPDVMIAKCAESLALRKAFPAELSGLYTTEEMQQADRPIEAVARVVEDAPPMPQVNVVPPVVKPPPAAADMTRFWKAAQEAGFPNKPAVYAAFQIADGDAKALYESLPVLSFENNGRPNLDWQSIEADLRAAWEGQAEPADAIGVGR